MDSSHFQIKQEPFPVHCDVCHQSDFFEPHTGVCQRCHTTLPADTHVQTRTVPYHHPDHYHQLKARVIAELPPLPPMALARAFFNGLIRFVLFFVILILPESLIRFLCTWWAVNWFPSGDPSFYLLALVGLGLIFSMVSMVQTGALMTAIFQIQQGKPFDLYAIYQHLWKRKAPFFGSMVLAVSYRAMVGLWGLPLLPLPGFGLFSGPMRLFFEEIVGYVFYLLPALFLMCLISLVPMVFAFGSSSFLCELHLLDAGKHVSLSTSKSYFSKNWRRLTVYWLVRWFTFFSVVVLLAALLKDLEHTWFWFWLTVLPFHCLHHAYFTIVKTLLFVDLQSEVRRRLYKIRPQRLATSQ